MRIFSSSTRKNPDSQQNMLADGDGIRNPNVLMYPIGSMPDGGDNLSAYQEQEGDGPVVHLMPNGTARTMSSGRSNATQSSTSVLRKLIPQSRSQNQQGQYNAMQNLETETGRHQYLAGEMPGSNLAANTRRNMEQTPIQQSQHRHNAAMIDNFGSRRNLQKGLWTWIERLPQPEDDHSIISRVNRVFALAEDYVDSFYVDKISQIFVHDSTFAEMQFTCLPAEVAEVISNIQHPTIVIKHCILSILLSCIAFDADSPYPSLLPDEFTVLEEALRSSTAPERDDPDFFPALSAYRVLLYRLRSDVLDDQNYRSVHARSMAKIENSLERVFIPWFNTRQLPQHRLSALRALMTQITELGITLFSQASTFVFDWQVKRSDGADPEIAVLPRMFKVYDNQAQYLSPVLMMIKMKTLRTRFADGSHTPNVYHQQEHVTDFHTGSLVQGRQMSHHQHQAQLLYPNNGSEQDRFELGTMSREVVQAFAELDGSGMPRRSSSINAGWNANPQYRTQPTQNQGGVLYVSDSPPSIYMEPSRGRSETPRSTENVYVENLADPSSYDQSNKRAMPFNARQENIPYPIQSRKPTRTTTGPIASINQLQASQNRSLSRSSKSSSPRSRSGSMDVTRDRTSNTIQRSSSRRSSYSEERSAAQDYRNVNPQDFVKTRANTGGTSDHPMVASNPEHTQIYNTDGRDVETQPLSGLPTRKSLASSPPEGQEVSLKDKRQQRDSMRNKNLPLNPPVDSQGQVSNKKPSKWKTIKGQIMGYPSATGNSIPR